MSSFARPTVSDIYSILRRHCALIVHFSGTPKGAGSEFEFAFPDDLGELVYGHVRSGVSSSVVMPNDEFDDFKCANATGCIGAILGLQSEQSLVDAHPSDCGSFMTGGVRDVPNARDMTAQDIERTITDRRPDDYNEWVIANFSVLGLFAAAPYRYSANVPIIYPDDVPEHLRTISHGPGFQCSSPEALANRFPGQPIYSFVNGSLVKHAGGSWIRVQHNEIYT